jgi:hypothetical protein
VAAILTTLLRSRQRDGIVVARLQAAMVAPGGVTEPHLTRVIWRECPRQESNLRRAE